MKNHTLLKAAIVEALAGSINDELVALYVKTLKHGQEIEVTEENEPEISELEELAEWAGEALEQNPHIFEWFHREASGYFGELVRTLNDYETSYLCDVSFYPDDEALFDNWCEWMEVPENVLWYIDKDLVISQLTRFDNFTQIGWAFVHLP